MHRLWDVHLMLQNLLEQDYQQRLVEQNISFLSMSCRNDHLTIPAHASHQSRGVVSDAVDHNDSLESQKFMRYDMVLISTRNKLVGDTSYCQFHN